MKTRNDWQKAGLHRVGLAAGALLAFGFAYRHLVTLGNRYTVESGVENWLFGPNDRAPLIVLTLSAWLAYRRWHRLRDLPLRSGPIWIVSSLLGVGMMIQAWAIHVGADDLQAVSLMAVASALLVLGWGLPGLRAMRLPVAFAVFCIPIPAPLLATWLWELRLFTAEYTGWLLYWIGVPALVSGDQILRASQAFQVIDGCSGFRSAETLTMLVVLMIDLFGRHGLHALLLLVSAPLVAFGLNGVRVLTLVLNPHSEIVAIHSLQGIAILLVGLLVVYVLDGVLGRLLPPRRMDPAKPGAQGGRALASEQLLAAALATAIVLVGIGLLTPVWSEPRPPRVLEDLVRGALPETDEAKEVGEDIYFSGKTAFRESIHRLYAKGAHSVELFVGTSDLRDRRATIVSPANSRPGSGWMLREARIVRVGKDDDPVLAQWVERGLDRRLTWSWYLGTRGTAEEALRNWLGLERSELRREGAQLVARLSTQTPSVGETDPRAEGRLEQFFERLQPALAAAVAPPSP